MLEELPTPSPSAEELSDPVARGQRVFLESGCIGCHTIEGLSAGTVGPNLTQFGTEAADMVAGLSAEQYIRQLILMPNAFVIEGYPENVMPQNFGEVLNQGQLDDLVVFLLAQK